MATRYSGQIVTDSLVLALDASSPRSYNGSGTTWYDLSGNSNICAMVGGVIHDSGSIQSMVFNSNYVSSSAEITPSTGPLTLCVWINLSETSGRGGVFERNDGGAYNGISMGQGGSSLWDWTVSGTSDYANDKLQVAFTYPSVGDWHYYVGTYDGSTTVNGYDNGVLVGSDSGSIQGNLNDQGARDTLNIARRPASSYINCKVGLVQVYNKVLSSAEVLQNYNATKGRFD